MLCLLTNPVIFPVKSHIKYKLIQCIEKGKDMAAAYCNLTADVAVPTLDLGACHQDQFSFSLECSSLIILETYKPFRCIQ